MRAHELVQVVGPAARQDALDEDRFVHAHARASIVERRMIDEVHVFRVRLDRPSSGRDLSGDEAERAGRFRFASDRDAYVRAHAALRAIVGRALGIAPRDVMFSTGPHGKPGVRGGLEINLSHAGGLALVAIGPRPLGVDVERVKDIDPSEVARRYFSAAERAALAGVAEGERRRGFYRGGTRKEAFLKATGEGRARELAGFDVSAGDEARLLATGPRP